MYKFILLPYCILLSIGQTYSQKNANNFNDQFPKFYWGVTVTPALVAKVGITGDKDKYALKSSPQFGVELLVNRYYNFEKLYTLVLGIGGGLLTRNFDYNITKEMFGPPVSIDISVNKRFSRQMDIHYFRLPVELEKRWPQDGKGAWNLTTGFSVVYALQYGLERFDEIFFPNGQNIQFLAMVQESNNNNGKPWFNFHISGGHEWAFKKKNIFRINLKANYSPTDFVTGTYRFNVGNQPELSGTYSVSGSYVGLSFSYIFYKNKAIFKK